MEKKLTTNLHNRFDIEVKDAKTGKIKQRAYAENLIMNQLWTLLLSSGATGFAGYIHLGTGTGTLVATRTTLFTFLVAKAAESPTYVQWSNYFSCRRSIQLLENENNDSVLSEIGLASAASGSVLRTHALLKDMNGNTVTITKVDTDIITIYATVYLRYPAAGWYDGGIVVPQYPNSTPCVDIRRLLGSSEAFSLWYFYGLWQPPHAAGLGITPTITYDTANKKITLYGRIPAASGNSAAGLAGMIIGAEFLNLIPNGGWYDPFSITGEQIGVGDSSETDFATAFPMIESGAIIKVDGTPVSATIHSGMPNQSDIASYMEITGTDGSLSVPFPGGAGVGTCYFTNPFYETMGIDSVNIATCILYSSSNGTDWTEAVNRASYSTPSTQNIPSEQQHMQYWKAVGTQSYSGLSVFTSSEATDFKNVILAEAPGTGAVITADYVTDAIPKDADHVFDLTIELVFAEYTP